LPSNTSTCGMRTGAWRAPSRCGRHEVDQPQPGGRAAPGTARARRRRG
jgi:hypothetical protein